MVEINLKEVYAPEKKRLEKLFDEQLEDIKSELVSKALYSYDDGEIKDFVTLIDKYERGYTSKSLVISVLDGQRERLSSSSVLLGSMVNVDTIHKTLTYALRELGAVDEDGYIIEEEDEC